MSQFFGAARRLKQDFSSPYILLAMSSLGENFVIYTACSGLARPRLVSGYRARIRTILRTIFRFTGLVNMIWNEQCVFDPQKLVLPRGRHVLCGDTQLPKLSTGDDASTASQLAATIGECFVMRMVEYK